MLTLVEFDLRYELAKAVKGQVLANLVVEHDGGMIGLIEPAPWVLFFDGSVCSQGCGIGLVIILPRGSIFESAILVEQSTNNQVQYQVVLRGLQLLQEAGAEIIETIGDSLPVIKELADEYECKDDVLRRYYEDCQLLLSQFRGVTFMHVPRERNQEANDLAQRTLGYRLDKAEIADTEA